MGSRPGLPTGEVFNGVGGGKINSNGEVIFPASLSGGSGSDESIWSLIGGSLSPIAREGDSGYGPALWRRLFLSPGPYDFGLSKSGDVAIHASIRGPDIGPAGTYGIWNYHSGAMTPIAIDGNTAFGPASPAAPPLLTCKRRGYRKMRPVGLRSRPS